MNGREKDFASVTDGRALETRKCGHGRVKARNGAPPNSAESFPRTDATRRVGGALLQDRLEESEKDSHHVEGDPFAGIYNACRRSKCCVEVNNFVAVFTLEVELTSRGSLSL